MEFITQNIKKHPYVSVFIIWLAVFMTFGRFSVEGVLPINYISPIVFGCLIIITYLLYSEKRYKDAENKNKTYLKFIILVSCCVLYTLSAVYIFSIIPFIHGLKGRNPIAPFFFTLAAVFAVCIYLTIKRKWSFEKALFIIFALSFAIHMLFMLSMLLWFQVDLGNIDSNDGHIGYILQLYNNFIPYQSDPRNKWQFYHPPLHYYIEAVLLRIETVCGLNIETAIYNIQYPALLYFMFTLITTKKITDELRLRKLPMLIVMLIMAFSPAFVCISNYANNDMLSVLFIMLCILHSMKWYKKRTFKNIIVIAFCFGFGMLTKLSVWMAAVPIAIFFIAALIENLRSKKFKVFWQLFRQMCVFLCVAAPLSLYWSLRNLIRFGVPIGYIPVSLRPQDHITVPLIQRLFDFNPHQFDVPNVVSHFFKYSYNEYNPLVALVKIFPYGFKVDANSGFFLLFIIEILLWTTITLCTVSLICMIYVLVKKNTLSPINKVMLLGTYLTVLISYYVFCIKYADVCTENIRYASPLVFLGAVFIGLTLKQLKKHNGKICKLLYTGIITLVILFCVTSLLVFTQISFNQSVF